MKKKHRPIPNPNKITNQELEFIQGQNNETEGFSGTSTSKSQGRLKGKGRMISMPDVFWDMLNNYLDENPTEGHRSGLIVRVVADYIKSKTSN